MRSHGKFGRHTHYLYGGSHLHSAQRSTASHMGWPGFPSWSHSPRGHGRTKIVPSHNPAIAGYDKYGIMQTSTPSMNSVELPTRGPGSQYRLKQAQLLRSRGSWQRRESLSRHPQNGGHGDTRSLHAGKQEVDIGSTSSSWQRD